MENCVAPLVHLMIFSTVGRAYCRYIVLTMFSQHAYLYQQLHVAVFSSF